MITYQPVSNDSELKQILALQQQNLAVNLSDEQIQTQGFVTVVHNLPLLQKMHLQAPSIIAKDEDTLAGYCLAMTKELKADVPVLVPMFDTLETLNFQDVPLKEAAYIAVGQVCVAAAYRGKGIFEGMYQAYKKEYSRQYSFAITEIAHRNKRSLQAHTKVGFQILLAYLSPDDNQIWEIVVWDWRQD
ncbi:GNAT family N-acetyltransferase [Rhodocytophaga rosea]|uniref:GNAT family N-acetyltransferase n=1 Tax=Rhodocytophaga rosea TaxID=2704465 RepID=A0A6C0GIS7_9BACT|nr:GNAT family N-acetyltransferase [Rhodocytophaga rosea]QHT67837.1 GNAT family N-acetyltransferase [Rhodocytophaga rosea]